MKKNFLVLLAVLFSVSVSFSQSIAVIEPELKTVLEKRSAELVSINIYFKSQIDRSSLGGDRDAVVASLKEFAMRAQGDVLNFLREEEKRGNVARIRSHWLANSINCEAAREVINVLADNPDIRIIGCSNEQVLLSSEQRTDVSAAPARGVWNATPHILQVNADDVWNLGYTGKDVVVAVLDSGTNPEHFDLKDHLWTGYADTDGDGEADDPINGWNFVSDNSNINDDYGHGTHCAGIVCGDGTVGNITGVAPDAKLMTVKIVNRAGGGAPAYMISGVEFAVENGADILSMSLGFKASQMSTSDIEAIRTTFENVLAAGVVVCAAAGNDGNTVGVPFNVDYPAACPPPYIHPDQEGNRGGLSSVVCVGSVNSNDVCSESSSRGPVTWQDSKWDDYPYDNENIGLIRPDICAPGELIYSLKHDTNDKYKYMSGTSQATPCVAGVMALMLEKNPALSPAEICEILETSAKKLSATKNNNTGSGRVDALAAINSFEAGAARPYIVLENYTPKSMSTGGNKELGFVVSNTGKGVGSNVTAVLSTDDAYVTIVDGEIELGTIQSGGTAEGAFIISSAADVKNGHRSYMTMTISDGVYTWSESIEIVFDNKAKIVYQSSTPGILKPGNNVALNVNMINKGTAATMGETKVTLVTSSPYVTIVDGEAMLGPMGVNEEQIAGFVVNVDESAPDNTSASFDVFAVPDNYAFAEDIIYEFEAGLDENGHVKDGFDSWTTFDASNDGRNHPWWHSSTVGIHGVETVGGAHSGKGQMMSETYCTASMQIYSVPIDNYLVSPKVKATAESKFCFKARVHSSNWYGEHFGVAVSETGNSSASDFVTIQEWSIAKEDGVEWIEFCVDLGEYAGKEIYVAIRHFFTNEQWENEVDYGWGTYILHVDDAMFIDVVDMSTEFVYDNYSYFSVTVEGNPLDAPASVTAVAVDKQSITVSWSAVANAQRYNIYRNGAYLTSTTALSYTDSGLSADTEYSYTIAAVYNGREYEHSVAAVATTDKADYSVKIKALSTEVLNVGSNTFGITVVNNGKYEQKSRSTLTLTTDDPYVTITTGSVGMKYLTVNEEITKEFTVAVDDNVPGGHIVNFNLNVKELFEDMNSWDLSFAMTASNDISAEIAEAKSVIDGWGVGYPNEAAKQAYLAALDAALSRSDIEAAKSILYAADAEMPVDGKAYYIKAKFNDGTFRYLYDNEGGLRVNSAAGERPNGYSGVFIFRALGDNKYALVNNNGKYMVYYADECSGAGGVSNGFADSYELGEYDAEITLVQGTRVTPTNPGTLDVATEFFGGFAMQAYNSSNKAMYYMMAGNPDFHYGEANSIYYLYGNRSSVFYLEEANYPNNAKLNDISTSTLIGGFEHDGLSTFSAPFPTLLPDGVKAYYATSSGWDNGCITLVEYAGDAIPAHEGFILSGEVGNAVMLPAAGETEIPVAENIMGNSAGEAKILERGECYILGNGSGGPGLYACGAGTLAMNKAYLNIKAGQSNSARIIFRGTTGVDEVVAVDDNVVYDLCGRRVEKPLRGVYVVNGKKVFVK